MDKGNLGVNYRKGLVLGLTLAEIFLLLLFLLLLVFSYLLTIQDQKWENLSDSFETAELPHETPEDIKQSMETLADIYINYQALSESIENPEQTIETLKAYKKIKDVLEKNGVRINDPNEIVTRLKEMTETEIVAEQYKQACGDIEKVKALLENLHGQDATAEDVLQQCPATIEDPEVKLPPEQQPETLADAEKVINRLRRTNASLSDTLMDITGGRGLVLPPCWVRLDDPNREIYTYNISIKDAGLVVQFGDDRTGQDLSVLDVNGPEPEFNKTISSEELQTRTKGMFDWSVENKCRFFVRILDETSDTNKAGYKAYLAAVENHFYKYLRQN